MALLSMLYCQYVFDELYQQESGNTMAVTVLLSIFAHGLTAFPGANWYGQKMSSKGK
ncbi:hypothetical protein [cf. Phormidesmis sp. LEGE 11477]|uniref:hypothetical protein n=1 Tax=cf. Phormidesmis sp. LEGE 11477 TaxID=1828680 RepID=UPI001D134969|nr:hypothetical protein [cf. Phormidesmis sp. LEGE 11477]